MADITMCKGVGCEVRGTCYRYTAEPSYMQSCFSKTPSLNGECEYYINHNKLNKKYYESRFNY